MDNKHWRRFTILAAGTLLWGLFGGVAYAGGLVDIPFDVNDFSSSSATIDNPYWPQPEGTIFTYRSESKDGCEVNDMEVTDQTPVIAGVITREIFDQVWEDDDCDGVGDYLTESTYDWYAQDEAGNVWYLGEDTESYCDRDSSSPGEVCSTAGSWVAGVDGAEPGIVMLADPTPGAFYQQEFAEDAQDMAKVMRTNAKVELVFDNAIETDEYTGCVETKEWSPLEPGAIEHKYYCPGVGLVLVDELKSGRVRTELVETTP